MKGVTLVLAPFLVGGLLLATGAGAASKPRLRVGYVAFAGTVPSERDLFGAPLLGYLRAVRKLGVQGRVVYVAPNEDSTGALTSLARQKYDLIINGTPDPNGVDAVAKRFPRVKFLLPATPIQALRHRPKNVRGSVYRVEEAAYLAGYLAALMDDRRRGKHLISAVGGVPFPGVTRWIVGYRAGAKKADPAIAVRVNYTNDFANPAKCRRAALSQIAAGSGVVFNVAGACGLGALRAAKEKGAWGVGVDVDQSFLGRHILTSAIGNWDKRVFDSVRGLVRGKFTTGGNGIFGLRNQGVELGRISPKVPRRVLRRLDRVRKAIITGKIRVPRVS